MSDLNLENIVGFKAVDKNGNERQVTVDEMTELVSARIVSAASEISTFAAAAAAGTDEFEDQLPQSDTFSWLRTLDGSKNPTLTSSSAAAKVLGELFTSLRLFPFMPQGTLGTDEEVNSTTKSGMYHVVGQNGISVVSNYSIMIVFNDGQGYVIQMTFRLGADVAGFRRYWNGEWGDFRTFVLDS